MVAKAQAAQGLLPGHGRLCALLLTRRGRAGASAARRKDDAAMVVTWEVVVVRSGVCVRSVVKRKVCRMCCEVCGVRWGACG